MITFLRILSLFLYIMAFYMPAFVSVTNPSKSLSGLLAFLLGAFSVEFTLFTGLAWSANFLYIGALVCSFMNMNSLWILILCSLSIVFSLGTFSIESINFSNVYLPEEVKLGWGYYSWVGSFSLLFICELIHYFYP